MGVKDKLVLLILFLIILINYVDAGTTDNNTILLKSRFFVPDVGINSSTKAKIESIPDRAHVLLQLYSIPNNKERQELKANGTELLSYIPNKGWFASIPSNKSQEIANLSIVRAITDIYPNDKLSFNVRNNSIGNYSDNGDGNVNLTVMFHKDVSLVKGNEIISKYGGNVTVNISIINAVEITILNTSIIDLVNNDTVLWIEEVPPPPEEELWGPKGSRAAVGTDVMQASHPTLNGTGIYVIVYDTQTVYNHSDLRGRVIVRDDGQAAPHATHVAGIIGGNGTASNGRYRGIAPNVSMLSYSAPGINRIISAYRDAIVNFSASIASNSWGWGAGTGDRYNNQYNQYTVEAKLFDSIIVGNLGSPLNVVFSAGNGRSNHDDLDNGGRWGNNGYYTLNNPKAAKNIIVVGATNSDDDSMTAFSYWGPTRDGRIKPDVSAPGCENISSYLSYGGNDELREANYNENTSVWSTISGAPLNRYGGKCGTSFAAPVVSGALALMLEDWRRIQIHNDDPLPSTLKAILMQTAKDLNRTGPDYMFGYGRVNITQAIDFIEGEIESSVIVESKLTDQGDQDNYSFYVPEGQEELKITLVWDDYYAEVNADPALVNDLDLVITAPNGTRYYPWTLDPNKPNHTAVRNQSDEINNVEQVYVNTSDYGSLSGIWNIIVNGTTMGMPGETINQNYSLVGNVQYDTSKLYIKDSSGENVAWLGDKGNIILKGTCISGGICNAPDGSFVVRDNIGGTATYIDSNGNMCIETGDCSDKSAICNPVNDAFVIQNETNGNAIFIDNTGDLCLTGILTQGGNP